MKFKLVIWSCLMTLTVMAQTPALIVKEIHQRMEKNTEDLLSLIKEMDIRLTQTTDPALQAIYHTMQADMVQQDYMLHRRAVEDRVNTHSQQPTDMREWDTQDYRHKIKTNLLASLLPADLLKKTPLRTYKNLITPQNFTSTTLYEFLAQEALSHPALTEDTQCRDSIYQALLRFQYQKTSPLAGLMTELTYLNQTQHHVKIHHQKLDSLLQYYADKPYAIEIVEKLAQIASRDSASQAYIYHLCQQYIQRFPDYPRLALLKNRLNTMERPQLRLRAPLQSYPGDLWKVSIYHTHLPQLTLRLKDANQHILMEKELTFTEHNPYSNYKDSVLLPLKKSGLYYCTLTSKDKQLNKTLPVHVSRLNIVDRTLATVHECWVTDFKTGRPVAQAQVKIYEYENQNPRYVKTYSTDKKGLLFLSADSLQKTKNFGYKPIIKGDTAAPITRRYPYFSSQTPQKARPNLAVFMDRGLYRPGQLIQFKAIATLSDHENQHVLPNESYTVTLRDSNQKELKQTTLQTNNFGSIAGSFLLPTHQLNGWYQLVFEGNGRTSTSFRVESYQRPTFKIKIRPLEGELSMGQK
ncbi:MAG: MG2 domain-containing protein, partial [Massilibacteroides sp.]|nr:MG2 domain-containing protein [Massilibacteroides sp.]